MAVATYGFDNENHKTMKGEIRMDYAKNKKYFQPVNLKLGIIVCIIGLILFAATPIAGIVGLAIGAFLIYFKLTTTGGTSISCAVRNIDDAQRSINGMRTLIKSKKMA